MRSNAGALERAKLHIIVGGVKTAALSGVWKGKDVAEWEEDLTRLHLYRPMGGDAEEMREFRFMVRRIERSLAILQKTERIAD